MINIDCSGLKIDPLLLQNIMQAVDKKEWFGLMRKRSIVIFCPVEMKSYWFNDRGIKAGMVFNSPKQLIDSIAVQVVTHRTFVQKQQLLQFIEMKSIPEESTVKRQNQFKLLR
jgi:hypothetical protein